MSAFAGVPRRLRSRRCPVPSRFLVAAKEAPPQARQRASSSQRPLRPGPQGGSPEAAACPATGREALEQALAPRARMEAALAAAAADPAPVAAALAGRQAQAAFGLDRQRAGPETTGGTGGALAAGRAALAREAAQAARPWGAAGAARGLLVEDCAAAAAAAAAAATAEALRPSAARLARAVAVSCQLLGAELGAAAQAAEARRLAATGALHEATLASFRQRGPQVLKEQRAALEQELQQRRGQVLERALEDVREYGTTEQQALQETARQTLAERLKGTRDGLSERLAVLEAAVARLADVEATGQLGERSCGSICSAVLAARGNPAQQGLGGRGCAVADNFARALLDQVPALAGDSTPCAVPCSPFEGFPERAASLAAAALAPPGGGGAAALVGFLFARAVVLGADRGLGAEANDERPCSEARRNLAALSGAGTLAARGQAAEALLLLEGGLAGECRAAAREWMAEARRSLEAQQALRALLARARCLGRADGHADGPRDGSLHLRRTRPLAPVGYSQDPKQGDPVSGRAPEPLNWPESLNQVCRIWCFSGAYLSRMRGHSARQACSERV
ncbi:unnamed protein product [Prorocentrum cordatum]|uniref:Uncharacterized protein n=1 Tax=Prorocentrum cordatum TaxID=2364126 RepID=A0ABN9TUB3_9DINO|nr:unnamed protein product [Polarella glacialis]